MSRNGVQLLHRWFPWSKTLFIANGPMLGMATAEMATAVSRAGGLGFIPAGLDLTKSETYSALETQLEKARKLLSLNRSDRLPIGIGLLTFHATAPQLAQTLSPLIDEFKPACLWLFAPSNPSPHRSLIPDLQKLDTELKILVQVGSVQAAREAVEDGASIIVAQGTDAGGHQWRQGCSIISLVPEISDMLDREFQTKEVALLAAGGIVDGRGAAAARILGADGIVMGTRFVVSKESSAKDEVRQLYVTTVDAGASTIKSTQHDDVRGTGFWPDVYDGRAIITDSYRDLQKGDSLETVQTAFKSAVDSGDSVSRGVIWSGTGVGLIHDIQSSGDIVETVRQAEKEILSAGASKL